MNNSFIKMLALGVLFAFAVQAGAVQAYHALMHKMQPDGTTLTYRLVGDERFHAFVTTDGYLLSQAANGTMHYARLDAHGQVVPTQMVAHNAAQRSAEEAGLLETIGKADFSHAYRKAAMRRSAPQRVLGGDFPTTGSIKGLILLVEFNDNQFAESHTRDVFSSAMNDEGYSGFGATGSSRDYFVSQSMGQFAPRFDVFGPIKLKKNMQYYGSNDNFGNEMNAYKMIVEACQKAHDDLNVDFSQYDYDNNGELDFVYVIYAGYAESYGASSNTIWPHASQLSLFGQSLELDGKRVERYACSGELKYTTGTQLEGIGTFCHEFSHVLGLPDMYNVYSSSSVQLGLWDVMDQGNYNNESHTPPAYSAFERASLGWLNLVELTEPAEEMTLAELTANNVAYRISTAKDNEYFVLENRQQQGWDAYQPGKGLMITHIDYDESVWNNNGVNAGVHPRVDIVEADGTQGYDYAGDLYPYAGNDMFTDYSSPGSLSWDGVPTEKGVTNIRCEDGVVKFRFMKDRLFRPVALDGSEVCATSFVANWQAVSDAASYRLNISERLTDDENPLVCDEDFSGMTEGEYPKSGLTEIGETVDTYTNLYGWYGSEVYPCGGYVRLGAYGKSGMLQTPVFDCTPYDGNVTLAFQAVSYPGKTVGYTVTVTDLTGNSAERQYSFKANKTEAAEVLHLEGLTSQSRFTFTTNNERLFINHFRLLKGNVADSEVWVAGPKAWAIDSIQGTTYTVEGLVPERTYAYTVEALSLEEQRSSLPSNEIVITTAKGSNGITVAGMCPEVVVRTEYYDLQGRRLATCRRGIVIRKTVYADSSVRIEKVMER